MKPVNLIAEVNYGDGVPASLYYKFNKGLGVFLGLSWILETKGMLDRMFYPIYQEIA